MTIQCPTCLRLNPANASYCYYDGRGLHHAAEKGPLGLGARPFSQPFHFSDGTPCKNFNDFVLTCEKRWNEARGYLSNGAWKSFFGALGRGDLAKLAAQAAQEPDPDFGLCCFLEGLPADAEILRPAKLALTSTEEDLGALEPGKDYKIDLTIVNQGMFLLRGSAITDCDWLSLGDPQGDGSTKHFQTRDTYSLSARVLGSKLRAAKKPLEGQIAIDTNGGQQTVAVRATVPIRPFPRGLTANDVLAGAVTTKELAEKAKKNPQEAAGLFEQGAVKAWYESNGWTYPIRATQAKGKGAVQQFFEALGFSKPPRLEINTQRIDCQGYAGECLTENVIVHTAESKYVYAEAYSNQEWIKVLPAKPQGKSVTFPLRIETPSLPGAVFEGCVTFLGNGQQRFDVPVRLTVAAQSAEQEQQATARSERLLLSLGSLVVLVGLVIAGMVVIHKLNSPPVDPPSQPGGPLAQMDNPSPQPGNPSTQPSNPSTQPGNPLVQTEPAKGKPWWNGRPGENLSKSVLALKIAAGEFLPTFALIEGSDNGRSKGYEQLTASLPGLARKLMAKQETKQALHTFVAECCAYDRSEFTVKPLLDGLLRQFPTEDSPFPSEDKGELLDYAFFCLGVVCDAIAHQAIPPDRSRHLKIELSDIFGSGLDPNDPARKFKDQAEKALAEQCCRNLLPTAERSMEQALTIREVLNAKLAQQIKDLRDRNDVKLLALGLAKGDEWWPKLEPIFKSCVESDEMNVGFKLVDLYEKASPELAAKMEALLAVKYKAARNPKLTQAAKAEAIRKRMAVAKVPPAQRLNRLWELLAKSPSSDGKSAGKKPPPTPLQETVRLAHFSTMACILFGNGAEERFDELIGKIPGSEQNKALEQKKKEEQAQQAEEKEVINPSSGDHSQQYKLEEGDEKDARRGTPRKVFPVRFQAGEFYELYMTSEELKPYIRVETADAAARELVEDQDRGVKATLLFTPASDGIYHIVVASSSKKKPTGSFRLEVKRRQKQQNSAGNFPSSSAQNTSEKITEKVTIEVQPKDLLELAATQSQVRREAFKSLTRRLPNDLEYRNAQKIANYLLPTKLDHSDAEREAVMEILPSLAKCRPLLTALADAIANEGEKLAQKWTVEIVGGIVKQKLRFAQGEDWRSACRRLLLQRALELTWQTSDEANKAAESLRDLYKDQGLAFGLDAADFQEQTQVTAVMESLIKHVSDQAAQRKPPPAGKAELEQMGRRVLAARFAAENDLECMVLLQRLWIKVLILTVQDKVPAPAKQMMAAVQQDLDKKDRDANKLIDQLRSGEESILRIWELVHKIK